MSGGDSTVLSRKAAGAALLGALVLACAGPAVVHAQTIPNAGSVLHQIEGQQPPALPPQSQPAFLPPPPLKSLGGPTVIVKSFRFAGNELLTDRQLAAAVAGFLDRPLDFAQLENAAIAVARLYRKAGWVVRVYLPQQDVTHGTVTIEIIEARFGAASVHGRLHRVSAERLARMVQAAQAPGAPVNANALDRALLLINDLPGVRATGRLTAGKRQGQTDLAVDAADTPLVTGTVSADNGGERFTGAAQVTTAVSLNSPLGIGDRADGMWLHSRGSDYESLAYSLPAGVDGWRVGVDGSHLAYHIITADFAALHAHGTSTTAGVSASYPLVRAPRSNLYFQLTAGDKLFDNDSAGVTVSHYSVPSATVSLYGNLFDTLGGGGATAFSLAYEQGIVDLGGSPNELADAETLDTAGSFKKLSLSLSRLQHLTDRLSLFAGVTAQDSSKNLDSSEMFYLGGMSGVRAYPTNEGGGDEGVLADLEARMALPAGFSTSAFFDWGAVRINRLDDLPGGTWPDTDELRGAGLSVAWTAPFGLSIRAIIAHRIGSNPLATSTGDDRDGSLILNRVWVQAIMPF